MTDRTTGEATDRANGRAAERDDASPDGFVDFFRRYTRTWVHAVATAGLTAFGTLTVVHRGFAALALAAYVTPPVALYLSRGRASDEERPMEPDDEAGGPRAEAGREPSPERERPDREAPGDDQERDSGTAEWTSEETPVDADLHDAVVTPGAAVAVGEAGVAMADDGDGWTVVLEDGPGADGNTLRGIDATADGAALWTAGDGGALGRLDAGTGRHVDFSAPEDITDSWVAVAVAGESGAETVLLANGSGEVIRGRYRDGEVAWTPPEKPGGGSSFSDADFADATVGYLCDTNDGVYRTPDAGETFERVGIDGPDGTLTGIAALGEADCLVCADDGVVHRYDGARWTPASVGDGALLAIARRGEYAVASAESAVYERAAAGDGWSRAATPVSGALRGVAAGGDAGVDRAIAVGDDGIVLERRL